MSEIYKLLLVEDDGFWLDEYCKYLDNEGYEINTAQTIQEAFDLMDQNQYDAVVSDLKLIGFGHEFGGYDVLKRVKELDPCTEVLIITGYGTRQIAAEVGIKGAFDYITKPPQENLFRLSVRGAIQAGRKKHQDHPEKRRNSVSSRKQTDEAMPIQMNLFGIMGNSRRMKDAFEKISYAVHTDLSVFVYGELGTGKTHIAKAIHSNSNRKNKPFSLLNYPDLSKHWSSISKTINRIHGGTFFVDNLTKLSSDSVKSLSLLIEELKRNDVRLIAACTTKCVSVEAIEEELSFPRDLLQAITEIPILIPPLRDRKDGDDIPTLVGHFIHTLTVDGENDNPVSVSIQAIERFVKYDYHRENVKELYKIVEQAINLAGGVGEVLEEHVMIPTKYRGSSRTLKVHGKNLGPYAFISYVTEDKEKVDKLQQDLQKLGIQIWRDRDQLYPGLRWKSAIKKAIQDGAFFIACFSNSSVTREKSYMYEELNVAIEELRLHPKDRAWFFPVKLDACDIPDWNIGGGETLNDIQFLDLSSNWHRGIGKLSEVIKGVRKKPNT